MFEGIEAQAGEERGGKRLAVAAGVAVLVLSGLVLVLVVFGERIGVRLPGADEPVVVSFKAPAPPEPVMTAKPPPPPPPKKSRARKKRPAASAVPPSAPVTLSDDALAEGDEAAFQSSVSKDSLTSLTEGRTGDDGEGDDAPPPEPVLEDEPAPRAPPKPVFVADLSTRPKPVANNPRPSYPESERKRGRESVVVVRFLVTIDGRVDEISVVDGEEPFVAAAIAAIKRWQYIPASIDGKPTAAYHRIRIPFRLKS